MVTVEVELKEGDEEPEQHLDDGEHIERVVVPISELYEKLQGKQHQQAIPLPARLAGTIPIRAAGDGNITFPYSNVQRAGQDRRRQVSHNSNFRSYKIDIGFLTNDEQALPLGSRPALEPTSSLRLTCSLVRFCRFRSERLHQRPVRCFSGLGLEMGRCCFEVRTAAAARRQSVLLQVTSAAIKVCRIDALLIALEALEVHCRCLTERIHEKSRELFLHVVFVHLMPLFDTKAWA
jgi:hypothetical protein